jgi:hypothetical protein
MVGKKSRSRCRAAHRLRIGLAYGRAVEKPVESVAPVLI